MSARLVALLSLAAVAGCADGPPLPVPFDAAHQPCRFCRMVGSNGRFAAELVAPHEEPLFFDDIGCLRSFLAATPAVPPGAVAFVVDHHTGTWVRATRAIYTRNDAVDTPMGSHLLAHESATTREADADARSAEAVSIAHVFPNLPLPDGAP